MKKLVFIMNDHAAVGKSSIALTTRGYLRDQGFQASLISITGEGHSDSPENLHDQSWDVVEEASIQPLFEMMQSHDALVCDVESGSCTALIELLEREDLGFLFSDEDIELSVITPEVEDSECHQEILEISEMFGEHADYVVMRVPLDQFSGSLESWENSKAAQAMDYLGAAVLDAPRLKDNVQEMLSAHDLSLTEALGRMGQDLPRYVEAAISEWMDDFCQELSEAADYLHPEPTHPAPRRLAGREVAVAV